MPGFDGTGPRGMGPMTGGGRGFCAVPLSKSITGIELLRSELDSLKAQLAEIETKIEYFKKTGSKSTERSE